MHEVLVSQAARRDLKRLPLVVAEHLLAKILSLASLPRPVGCRKLSGSLSDWRLRTGDYRIIYAVDDHRRVVKIERVVHRREAYR